MLYCGFIRESSAVCIPPPSSSQGRLQEGTVAIRSDAPCAGSQSSQDPSRNCRIAVRRPGCRPRSGPGIHRQRSGCPIGRLRRWQTTSVSVSSGSLHQPAPSIGLDPLPPRNRSLSDSQVAATEPSTAKRSERFRSTGSTPSSVLAPSSSIKGSSRLDPCRHRTAMVKRSASSASRQDRFQ